MESNNSPRNKQSVRIELMDWDMAQNDAMAIRYEVFVHEQGVPMELERDENDAISMHAVAYALDGSPLGTGRLLPEGHIGRMAVSREAREQGVGGKILEALVEQAQIAGHTHAILSAQCHAQHFYSAHGFVAEGEIFDDAGIDHIQMVRKLNQVAGTRHR